MDEVDGVESESIRCVSIGLFLIIIIRACMDPFELVGDRSFTFSIDLEIAINYDARVTILIILENKMILLHLIDLVHQVTLF